MSRFLNLMLIPLAFAILATAADDSKKAKGPLKLPAGAEKIEAYTHRHTDADGKTWIY